LAAPLVIRDAADERGTRLTTHRSMKWHPSGKVVITAGTGADAALPVGPFYVRDISVHGFVISRARPATSRTRPG
jgi:hypothetical protein